MATQFFIKPIKETTDGKVFARVRRKNPLIDVKLSTNQVFSLAAWRAYEAGMDTKTSKKFRAKYEIQWDKLDAIMERLDSAVEDATDANSFSIVAKRIIHLIVDAEAIEEARKDAEERARIKAEEDAIKQAEEERKRANDFMDYYRDFCNRAETGEATKIGKGKGAKLSKRSRINYQQGYRWLCDYQENELGGRGISFDDIDSKFFADYQRYLNNRTLVAGKNKGKVGCTQNTLSMRVAELKTVLKRACEVDKVSTNTVYRDTTIGVDDVDVDAIALTRKELDAIIAVDLSKLPECYTYARDIFMVGVLTAQRCSDYNGTKDKDGNRIGGIKPEDIRTFETDVIVTDKKGHKTVETRQTNYISIRQRKTGKTVEIPVNSELQRILDKYGNELPFVWEQKLNTYIKAIGELAGLTDKVMITTMRGGESHTSYISKYQLITTHTARRTGATLMYNAGVDLYDIMKITGHSSLDMLRKYLKCGNGESAHRIASKYAYFQ